MDDNNNLNPVQGEEVKDFSVTENNSWDAPKPGQSAPIPPQQSVPVMPQQGAPIPPQQGVPVMPQQGAPIPPQQGVPVMPQQGAPIPPQQGPGPMPANAPMPYRGTATQPGLIPEMSVPSWLLTLFLADIPIAGLILRIIWAADSSRNSEGRARKNWAIASLLWDLIKYVIGVVLSYIFFYSIVELFDYYF